MMMVDYQIYPLCASLTNEYRAGYPGHEREPVPGRMAPRGPVQPGAATLRYQKRAPPMADKEVGSTSTFCTVIGLGSLSEFELHLVKNLPGL